VEVERTAAESDMRELDAQLGALQIKALRLEAQLTRKSDFKVPADLAKRFPDQVETARALLLAQKSRVGSSYEAQSQKISQRSAEQAELQARRAHTEGKLRLLRQQIEINQKLLAEGLANRYEHLNLLKKKNWPGAPSRKSTPPCAGWRRPRSRRTRPCARSTRGTRAVPERPRRDPTPDRRAHRAQAEIH
jgi:hypothetical protein